MEKLKRERKWGKKEGSAVTFMKGKNKRRLWMSSYEGGQIG